MCCKAPSAGVHVPSLISAGLLYFLRIPARSLSTTRKLEFNARRWLSTARHAGGRAPLPAQRCGGRAHARRPGPAASAAGPHEAAAAAAAAAAARQAGRRPGPATDRAAHGEPGHRERGDVGASAGAHRAAA
eukprot:scaffold5815_cov44-Phaeocystis_antarctica.AAC.1